MIRNAALILSLFISVPLLSGCKTFVNDAEYCHQGDLDSDTPDERFCVQMDSIEIQKISKIISNAKIYKRAKFVSYNDGYLLPGTINITTNSLRRLTCRAGASKILCDNNIAIEIDRINADSYEDVFRSFNFYSKLRTSSDSATSCRELLVSRLQKQDSAIIMMSKDLTYYAAATCTSIGSKSIQDGNDGNDTLPLRINPIKSSQLICIPGETELNLDELSLGFSKSIIEFAGRFREFRVDRIQIPDLCRNENLDSINDWVRNASKHHETCWADFIDFANHLQSINPDCNTAIRNQGIANEIILADKLIKRLEEKQ